jgi:hypothetical protein
MNASSSLVEEECGISDYNTGKKVENCYNASILLINIQERKA